MAHLLKVEDYTSRYQHDIQRYPSQFTRLKKERWLHIKKEWIRVNRREKGNEYGEFDNWFEEADNGFFAAALHRLKHLSGKNRIQEEIVEEEREGPAAFYKGKSMEELKEIFYEDLFQAQLQWASSSLFEESRMNPKYKYDQKLRYFLREFPDNYLVLYYPVFSIGKAPVEMDIILISPTDVYFITTLEGKQTSVFETSSGRFWNEYVDGSRNRRVSPVIPLNRMTAIARDILQNKNLNMKLNRVVLTPAAIIDHRAAGMKVEMVDKRNHEEWLEKMKRHPSPVKKNQLETADLLLQHTVTTSFRRKDLFDNNEEI
ncbi:NERD domain-containing protein [Alteribacillus sp. YIM 98480]|uniref:NERD domain-containing protein n=1 Tax=Alteribacillus sp. YIM 98480 TaxID=2606599 RepID=UPI00131B5E52|nr:NERD domain-containing protein [Alteribacillus sp. YIM 98480]